MRPVLFITLAAGLLIGCNADPGARREIALLKAEILDLEDNYYALLEETGRDPDRAVARRPRTRLRDRMRLGATELAIAGDRAWQDDPGSGAVYSQDPAWDDACDAPVDNYLMDSGVPAGTMAPTTTPFDNGPPLSMEHEPVFNPPQSNPNTILDRNQPSSTFPAVPGSGSTEPVPLDNQPGSQPEEIRIDPNTEGTGTGGTGTGSSLRRVPAGQVASAGRPANGQANSPRANNLILLQKATSGVDQNGDGKDDGLQISFQLLDGNGMPIAIPSPIVFSLIDPALPSGQQRLGLWEHMTRPSGPMLLNSPDEAPPQQVILRWQEQKPQHENLLLFARHMRADGTALETSIQVDVRIPGSGDSSPPADRTTRRDDNMGAAPEINIDVAELERLESEKANRGRRPLWRATR